MKSSVMTIAVDALGGDFGLSVTIPAVVQALSQYSFLHIILIGPELDLKKALASYSYPKERLHIQHASQCVAMDDKPSYALRNKKDSSMRVAINLVKEKKADACVSAGNTGALMLTAKFVLKTLPGIDRPAIVSSFPTVNPNKKMRMLDLGANIECNATHLVQFALMGSVLVNAIDQIKQPKVYLLNIGEEEIKGNESIKEAAQLLSESHLVHYAGFIEGDALFQGTADVVVCDGFLGNVALKTTEGVSRFIINLLKQAFQRTWWTRMLGLLVKPIFKAFARRVNPAEYNGAIFLGLNGIVVKSHGGTDELGFKRAIEEAIMGVEKNIPSLIRTQIECLLPHSLTDRNIDNKE